MQTSDPIDPSAARPADPPAIDSATLNRNSAKIPIDAKTVFENEVKFAYDEIRTRLDFSRRLLALQIQVLAATATVFVFLANTNNFNFINRTALEFAYAVILWLSFAFGLEQLTNESHIGFAAAYLNHLINNKYEIPGYANHRVHDWQQFVAAEHNYKGHFLVKRPHNIDSAFVINVLVDLIAVGGYVVTILHASQRGDNWHRDVGDIFAGGLFLTALLANFICYVESFRPRRFWNNTNSEDSFKELADKYGLSASFPKTVSPRKTKLNLARSLAWLIYKVAREVDQYREDDADPPRPPGP